MNPEKLEKIFTLMQSFGVEYFKHEDLEIKMSISVQPKEQKQNPKTKAGHKSKSKQIEPQAIPPVEMNIPHKPNEVMGLLKLSDEELVDKLFPDYSKVANAQN